MSFSWEPDPRTLAEARLSGLVQSLVDALIFEDEHRRILLVNQAFCDLFAVPAPPEALKGYDCVKAAQESKHLFADPEGALARIDDVLAAQAPVHCEMLQMADGRVLERDYVPVFLDHHYSGHLWRYRDITSTTRARQRLTTVSAVSRGLVDATTEVAAYERVIESVCQGLGWPMGAAFAAAADDATLVPVATYAFGGDPVAGQRYRQVTSEFVPRFGEGLPGLAWKSGRSLWATDVQQEPTFVRRALAKEIGLRSVAEVPVMSAGVAIGVLEFVTTYQRELDAEAQSLLESIGAQLGQVVARIRAQASLIAQGARLRAILDSALDAILTIDASGHIEEFNPAAERMFGRSRQEAIGQRLSDLIVPEALRAQHEAGLARHVRTGESRILGKRLQLPALVADGTTIPVEVSIVRVETGGAPIFTGFIRDVSVRLAKEQALEASEQRTRAVIEQMLEGVLLADEATGVIRLVNPAAERMFGYEAGQMIGLHVRDLMPRRPEYDAADFLTRTKEHAMGRTTEWEARHKSGRTFPFELQLASFDIPEGRVVAGFLRDLTERHAVKRLKKQFVATVSHELRTPLTSVRGSLGLLASGAMGEFSPAAIRLVEIAERNVVRLVGLINDILDLERLEGGRMPMSLAATALDRPVSRSVEAVAAMAAQGNVSLAIQAAAPTVAADEDRVVQVLVNLLSNAIKFSPAGTEVALRVECIGGLARLEVLDRGPGVPEESRDLIFEPFSQAEGTDVRQKGGSGLGLAICKAIVDQHRGDIGYTPREGGGSRFWFTLPLAASEQGDA